ncbi:NADPH:quinone reductase [Nocardioides sp. HDW12B]|uniref:NADPH:quinone reductase n=1 Tax=Nocardioides sp. HDW12B TaxID=2714939 RepID=UPI0014072720|nr:NADPH:quinone reductase [Nocardioides sp. HDW12B]QIK66312.1 NADPH:quinone reductase [Nocardioides sp. HDW12B]
MRAISYAVTGEPDVLTLSDKQPTEPGPGEVRVAVHRSGVNPTDWKNRRGAEPGVAVEPAQVPNQDGAGVVEAVGEGVDESRVGERVWLWEAAFNRPDGTAQELTVLPADRAVPLPDEASFDLGASVGIPFMTAHRCLTVGEGGPLELGPGALDGVTVLVSGGAGAVGNAAIKLATWSGAEVITTVSGPEKADLARRAGARHVVNYREEDVVEAVREIAPDGVHVVVEVAAAANAEIVAGVLATGGAVAVYADDDKAPLTLPVRPQMLLNARWQFVLVYSAPAEWKQRAVRDVSRGIAEGVVTVGEEHGVPLHHFALEDTAGAHAAVESGAVGKVIVDVTG